MPPKKPPLRAGLLLVLALAALAWTGLRGGSGSASLPQNTPTRPWGPVVTVIPAITTTGTGVMTTATSPPSDEASPAWHGPVVSGTASPTRAQVEATATPTIATPIPSPQTASDASASSGNSAPASVGIPDGGGSDGTLRRIAVPILMYHYISVPPEDADIYRLDLSVTPEHFRAQMQYLADHGYQVISLYDLNLALRWGTRLPPRPVVLTFDDGYRDAYENAFPILQAFGYTGTFFVVTQRMDEGHPAYLTWAQAREMTEAGMSIESHTKDHPNLRGRGPDFLYYQIQGSMESIEAHTGHRSRLFNYPAGRWDEAVLDMLEALDVWAAVTTEGGIEHTTDATLLLRRVRISGDTDLETFGTLLEWTWDQADS